MTALRATFKPEFLNRVDEIIVFHQLGEAELRLDRRRPARRASRSCSPSASSRSS